MITITTGSLKGLKLSTHPGSTTTRPTSAKVRQAICNAIQSYIPQSHILDLYAGSGALGLEALSRGGLELSLVESHKDALNHLYSNCQKAKERLGDRAGIHIFSQSVHDFLGKTDKSFDIIFCDPPYQYVENEIQRWGKRIPKLLNSNGVFILECRSSTSLKISDLTKGIFPETMELERLRKYGDTSVLIWRIDDQ